MQISFLALIKLIILKYSFVEAEWISTILPLPEDLELLLDSLYDDGAEYYVKYDDITGDDIEPRKLLSDWERPASISPTSKAIYGIIDPDRDGARNQPPWMNFSKAVFVPNEIDYKIRARHKFHPHSGRIGGTLQKQRESFDEEENGIINAPETMTANSLTEGKATKAHNAATTAENLNFLLPIPNYSTQRKPMNEEKLIERAKNNSYSLQNMQQMSQQMQINKKLPIITSNENISMDSNSMIISTKVPGVETSESLHFLHPIPSCSPTVRAKQLQQNIENNSATGEITQKLQAEKNVQLPSIMNECKTTKLNKAITGIQAQRAVSKQAGTASEQHKSMMQLINDLEPSDEILQPKNSLSGSSILGIAGMISRKMNNYNRPNLLNIDHLNIENSMTLDALYNRLLRKEDESVNYFQARKTEEEKNLNEWVDSVYGGGIHNRKLKTLMRPVLSHTRKLRPGHISSYTAHIGPLRMHHNYKYNKELE